MTDDRTPAAAPAATQGLGGVATGVAPDSAAAEWVGPLGQVEATDDAVRLLERHRSAHAHELSEAAYGVVYRAAHKLAAELREQLTGYQSAELTQRRRRAAEANAANAAHRAELAREGVTPRGWAAVGTFACRRCGGGRYAQLADGSRRCVVCGHLHARPAWGLSS